MEEEEGDGSAGDRDNGGYAEVAAVEEEETVVFLEAEDEVVAEEGAEETGEGGEE